MSDLETTIRATLAEHALDATPSAYDQQDAIRDVSKRRMRHRVGPWVAAGAAALIVVGVMALTDGGVRSATPAEPVNRTSTATSRVNELTPGQPPSTSTAPATAGAGAEGLVTHPVDLSPRRSEALQQIFGSDYSAQPQSAAGFGGDLTLTLQSASAAGLPAGYPAAASRMSGGPVETLATGTVDSLTTLCAPLVEKGATTTACVPETHAGIGVQTQYLDAPNTKIGTWAYLRVFFQRPDESIQFADMTVWSTQPTTAKQRAAARSWLAGTIDRLARAAAATVQPVS